MLATRFSEKNFNDWKKAEYVKHFGQIESVLNHIHIVDLFSWEKQQDITVDQIRYFGEKLKQMYQTKLKVNFPKKEFEVSFNGNNEFEDIYDYQISFSQPINDTRYV